MGKDGFYNSMAGFLVSIMALANCHRFQDLMANFLNNWLFHDSVFLVFKASFLSPWLSVLRGLILISVM